MKISARLLIEENKKLRRLQLMINLITQILYQTPDLELGEGLQHIRNAREFAISLFPDKGETFDLIYRPRLLRVLKERKLINFSEN